MPAPNYVSNQQSFGPGIAVITAGQVWSGPTALDPNTPIRIALVQSCSFELDLKLKAAYGPGVFPVGFGSGQGSVKLKLKLLSISGWALNAILFGQTSQPPQGYQVIYNSPNVIPGSTPWQVTIAGAKQDLGVYYAPGTTYPTGVYSQQLTQVASPTLAGTYSFNASTGVYTFQTADANKAVLITYATQPATPYYEQWQFSNPLQSGPPTFALQFAPIYNGQTVRITCPYCSAEKYVLPTKQGDWVEYEIDAQAGTVGDAGLIFTQDMIAL